MTSDVYDVFVNHEKSFREGLSTRKSLSYLHSHIYIFMNETHCPPIVNWRESTVYCDYPHLFYLRFEPRSIQQRW